MKSLLKLVLIFLAIFTACSKDDEDVPVTVHCDSLITDTTGTGDNGSIFMPNAFTPNSDGINDISRPLMVNIAAIQFSIYDNNSNEVFSTSTLGQGWNTTTPTSNSAVNIITGFRLRQYQTIKLVSAVNYICWHAFLPLLLRVI